MSTKSKVSLSTIITAIAALGFLVCFCVKGFQIGEIYREYSYNVDLGTFIKIFHEHLYDYVIYLLLAVGAVLYRKDSRALPIVLLAYMVYSGLIIAGRFLILETGADSDVLGLLCVVCGIVAAIIWIVKPQQFKMASLLFVPYIIYIPYSLLTKYIDNFEWITFAYNISEMILFLGIVLKCTTNENSDKQFANKSYFYWVPSIVLIFAQCIAYLVIVTA